MSTDLVQTFYVDSHAVANSSEVHLTSIELYFRDKPATLKNSSGSSAPGVSIYLCDIVNEVPVLTTKLSPAVRVDYEKIYPFSDASASTVFPFQTPITLKTDRAYGIVTVLEDSFTLWKNVQNDFLINSNQKSSGSSTLPNGRYYEVSSTDSSLKYISDTNIKFKVNIAKYISNTATQYLVNNDYEFLSLANVSGTFTGGELVWQSQSNAVGTISVSSGNTAITGNGTVFTALSQGSYIIVNGHPIKVGSVIDDHNMISEIPVPITNAAANFYPAPTGEVFYYNPIKAKLYLTNSSSNTSLLFTSSGQIYSEVSNSSATISSVDSLQINGILPKVQIDTSSKVDTTVKYVLANSSLYSSNSNLVTLKKDEINDSYGFVASKSLELTSNNMMNNKSLNIEVDFNINQDSNTLFSYPKIDLANADVYSLTYNISSNTFNGLYDTEANPLSGTGKARYVSNKVSFANNRFAEDSVIYINAYRPANTDIQAYVKLHNSTDTDAFDDKFWTPLVLTENSDRFSSSNTDLIEYSFMLPLYPSVSNTAPGKYTTQTGNNIIAATSDPTSSVAVNSAIKIVDPLFPDNYDVRIVTAANTTTITVDSAMGSNGSGLNVDNLVYSRTAFRNKNNSYISRYYSENGSIFDSYDSMQVKIVLVSSDPSKVPAVDYLQFIGVSA